MIKQRMLIDQSGVQKSLIRLKQLCGNKFSTLYNKVVSFPFDGFDNKSIASAKKIHVTLAKGILSKQLNYQWVQIQNKDVQNRLSIVLQNKLLGWGVVDNDYNVTVPQNIKLKNLFNEIDKVLDLNNSLKLYDLYLKYTQAPYGLNDYSFSLVIAVYIIFKSIEVKVFQDGKAIKTIDWAANFYKEKSLDFKYLRETEIEKIDLDKYLLRYQIICDKIQKNIDINSCVILKKELEELLSEEEPPEEFETKVEACRRIVSQGEQIYNKVEKEIGRMKGDLERGIEELNFKYITEVILTCEEKTTLIEEGLPYQYNQKQLDTFDILADKGREIIESQYEEFLEKKAKCRSVGQMTKYEAWMNHLRKDLDKLGYIELARKTKSKLEQELESLKLIAKRQSMEEDIKKFLATVKPGEYTSQEQLLAWDKEGKQYINTIKDNTYIDKRDKEDFIVAINVKLNDNTKFLNKINDSIMDIIDKSLELKSIKDANNLLVDIRLLLEKKLRANDRSDIEEIGAVIQNLLNDIKDIEILDSLNDRIKDAELLKEKYTEYENEEILSSISIIDGYIDEIQLKIEKLNEKWKEKNLSFSKNDIDEWNTEQCFSWVKETRGLPEYLTDKTIDIYNEFKSKVEVRINNLQIDSIVNIFKELSEYKKKECINLLNDFMV